MRTLSLPANHFSDWAFLVLLTCAVLLLISRAYAPKRFLAFCTLPFNPRRKEILNDFKPFNGIQRFEGLMSLSSYLILALVLFQIKVFLKTSNVSIDQHLFFVRILFFLIIFFLLKALVNAFLEWLYGHYPIISLATNFNLGYRIWSAVFLLPLSFLCLFFSSLPDFFFWVMASFLTGSYVLSVVQSNVVLWKMPTPIYYKVFYICALEIMPIFFLITWLF